MATARGGGRLRCLIAMSLALAGLTANTTVLADSSALAGGNTTVDDASSRAYSHPLSNLSDPAALLRHDLGDQGFRRNFGRVRVGGSVLLGPKFNNSSCVGCHPGNGRGSPTFGRSNSQLVVKISAPKGRATLPGGPLSVRGLGTQLRDHSTGTGQSDGRLRLLWDLTRGFFDDGTAFELRKPVLKRGGPATRLPSGTMFSLRRPPPVFGSGLLDAVAEQSIQALADPGDQDGDGISGRPNVVWNIKERKQTIGKFGLKASAPTAQQQVAGAYATDMGVTNSLLPRGNKNPELDSSILERTSFYVQTLAVPSARNQDDPTVVRGREIFREIGCGKCHTETLQTGDHQIPELSNQVIHPFTDLLLHDMGSELSDGRPEFQASGNEWRTAPLWGIGLAPIVIGNAEVSYLHDGRARTLEEAVLWHGGEGLAARNTFASLTLVDRDALIQFLRSL